MARHNTTGSTGESMAEAYLLKKEFTILQKNWRHSHWEVVIIAQKNNILHFIEVKTRRNIQFGYPCEAVGKTKQKHILNVARYYMWRNNIIENYNIRFDVIEVYYSNNYYINHIQNCF